MKFAVINGSIELFADNVEEQVELAKLGLGDTYLVESVGGRGAYEHVVLQLKPREDGVTFDKIREGDKTPYAAATGRGDPMVNAPVRRTDTPSTIGSQIASDIFDLMRPRRKR